MTSSPKPKLISSYLCPFVQRSVITLLEKGVDFDISYVDLDNKPDWFLKLSPFGKVPILQIEETVIFESAVINEYLDESHPPSMHPADLVQKAHNRSWVEVASQLNMDLFFWTWESDPEKYDTAIAKMIALLQRVEDQLGDGLFFNGDSFALVDAAFAPFFMRLEWIADALGAHFLASLPKCLRWHLAMKVRPSIKESVVPDIQTRFLTYIRQKNGVMAGKVK